MDSRSYDAISKDIISRWTYPMVLDESMPNADRLHHHRGHRYFGKDGVSVSENAIVGGCSVIGSHSAIREDTALERSVIGQSVAIGKSTKVAHSYIWSNTSVGEKCDIRESIIADRVVIEDEVTISSGCFVAQGVRILKGTTLPPFTRVGSTRWNEEEEEEEDVTEKEERVRILGASSQAHLWPSDKVDMQMDDIDSDDEQDEDLQLSMKYSRIGMRASSASFSSASSLSTIDDDGSDEEDADEAEELVEGVEGLTLENAGKVGAAADFAHECIQSLERAFEEGHTSENASIELKTLRMASNVQLSHVRKVVIDFCLSKVDTGSQATYKAVEEVFGRWAPLVIEMTKEDQTQSVLLAQEYCAAHASTHLAIFMAVLRAFYEYEIASEDAIFGWYKLDAAREDGNMRTLWEKSRRFIQALLEADSESESE